MLFEFTKDRNVIETGNKTNRLYGYVVCRFWCFMTVLKSVGKVVVGSYEVPNIE